MAIAEILTTKKEEFTVFEDGHITRRRRTKEERRHIQPTSAETFDVYPIPPKPAEGEWAYVELNIWGEEISREYENIREWRRECDDIREKNAIEHQKQKKEFKEYVRKIKKECRLQEKQNQKAKIQKERELIIRKRSGARAWAERMVREKAYIR